MPTHPFIADGDQAATAAVQALVRALASFDGEAGRRASHRASLADEIATGLQLSNRDRVVVLGAALLTDVAILTTRTSPPSGDLAWQAVLGATMLENIPGLDRIATTIRHLGERWDGSGAPHGLAAEDIPPASQVVAAADSLVQGATLSANHFDPTVLVAADAIDRSFEPQSLQTVLDTCQTLVATQSPTMTRITSLSTIGEIIEAIDDVKDVLALIAEHARAALGASTVSIARLDHEQGFLQVLVNVGDLAPDEDRFPQEDVYSITDLPELEDFRAGDTKLRRVSRGDNAELHYLADRELSSEAVVPIMVADDAWGIVWATTADNRSEFTPTSVRLLQDVAGQMSAGVRRARRFHELEQLSYNDTLTGLGNRLVLNKTLDAIFERPAAVRSASVIMCDVDNLKDINDNLGHEAGDEVLQAAAQALRNAVSDLSEATVVRMGGDEFCVVINGPESSQAQLVADKALRLFQAQGRQRSFSCGVAYTGPDVDSGSDLLRLADHEQYKTKKRHRLENGSKSRERNAPPLASGPTGRRAQRDS